MRFDSLFLDKKMSIGDRIRMIRGELSQKAFAKKISAGQGSIHAWENDKAYPGASSLERIHRIFGVNVHWLLTGEGEPYIKDRGGGLEEGSTGRERLDRILEAPAASPDPDASTNLGRAVEMLAAVLSSGDQALVQAIMSNLIAFSRAVRDNHRHTTRIARLEEDGAKMRERIAALERKLSNPSLAAENPTDVEDLRLTGSGGM